MHIALPCPKLKVRFGGREEEKQVEAVLPLLGVTAVLSAWCGTLRARSHGSEPSSSLGSLLTDWSSQKGRSEQDEGWCLSFTRVTPHVTKST